VKFVAFPVGIGYIASMSAEIVDKGGVKRTIVLKGAERTGIATANDMTKFAVKIVASEPDKGYRIEIAFPGLDGSGTFLVERGEPPFAYHDNDLKEKVQAVPA